MKAAALVVWIGIGVTAIAFGVDFLIDRHFDAKDEIERARLEQQRIDFERGVQAGAAVLRCQRSCDEPETQYMLLAEPSIDELEGRIIDGLPGFAGPACVCIVISTAVAVELEPAQPTEASAP